MLADHLQGIFNPKKLKKMKKKTFIYNLVFEDNILQKQHTATLTLKQPYGQTPPETILKLLKCPGAKIISHHPLNNQTQMGKDSNKGSGKNSGSGSSSKPSNNPNYPSTTGKPSGGGRGNTPKK